LAEQPVLGSCSVQLRPPGSEWTYTCRLSVDLTRDLPAASSSTSSTALAFHDLRMHCRHRSFRGCSEELLAACLAPPGNSHTFTPEADLELWVSFSDGQVCSVKPEGNAKLTTLLQRHRNLLDWMDQPGELEASVFRAIEKVATDANSEFPTNLGCFVFKQPSSREALCKWFGQFRLLDAEDMAGQKLVALIQITQIRELNSSALQDVARPSPTPAVEPPAQVIGHPRLSRTL